MSPFDKALYERLLEGLEATEMMLSDVRAENDKLRIDSGYFAKPMLAAERRIRTYVNGHDELGALFSRFVKGIFDINADAYVDEGVPFIRIQNLKDGLIDTRGLAFLPEDIYEGERKTQLLRGDIVLSKTAYPAASLVTLERANTSQDTIATTLSEHGRANYRASAVVAYLNSPTGQALLRRQFQGNVQLHLSLDDGRKVPVPRLSDKLQTAVEGCFLDAETLRNSAAAQIARAEQSLLHALGLDTWTPPDALTYVRSSREAFAAGRFDAEYFHPAKAQALADLRAMSDVCVGDLFDSIRDLWQPTEAKWLPVRNYDLTDALDPFLDPAKPTTPLEEIASTKKRIAAGDLVVSRLRSYLREIAFVLPSDGAPTVASTEFIVLRPKKETTLSVEALLVYLRSRLPQVVFQWSQDGSNHPRFDERELLNLPVPRALIAGQATYEAAVRQMVTQRQHATRLLDAAKRAVEMAIEDSEAAALAYLAAANPPETAT
jgi:type I restriction enzyme S subunit